MSAMFPNCICSCLWVLQHIDILSRSDKPEALLQARYYFISRKTMQDLESAFVSVDGWKQSYR